MTVFRWSDAGGSRSHGDKKMIMDAVDDEYRDGDGRMIEVVGWTQRARDLIDVAPAAAVAA